VVEVLAENRPSKKQQELLSFIDGFINQHGYGPSYREIMRGVGYKSVSTVATHVDNLIVKGLLNKRDNSARSLEVVKNASPFAPSGQAASPEQWLSTHVAKRLEKHTTQDPKLVRELQTIVRAFEILDLPEAAIAAKSRLEAIQNTQN
jgi:repressor LexA